MTMKDLYTQIWKLAMGPEAPSTDREAGSDRNPKPCIKIE
jgi:hypothetical protein